MNYKAVAFDMDGTLLNKDRQILPQTVDAIQKLRKKGIQVVLVTGRYHSMIYPYYLQLGLDSITICCNGTYLYDFKTQQVFDGNPISKEHAFLLQDKIDKFGIQNLIYTDAHFWYQELDENSKGLYEWTKTLPVEIQPKMDQTDDYHKVITEANQIFKFLATSKDIPALRKLEAEIETMNVFECERSWIDRADISAKGNNKGRGLELWAKRSGFDLSEVVAFGDNFNDATMLQLAGLGVVMGNAEDEIKALGDKVIGDHNSAAIATCLHEIFNL